MNAFPESETAQRFARRRLPGADRGGEVPDRLRPAAPAHDVRGQGADRAATRCRRSRRLNRIHPEKSDTFVLDFRNELEDDPGGVPPVLRAHGGGADRPEPPLRQEPRAVGVRRAARGGGRGGGAGAARGRPRRGATAPSTRRSTLRSRGSASSRRRCRTRSATSSRGTSRIYSFVSQIVPYVDRALERDYVYARRCSRACRGRRPSGSISAARWS